ncbi:tetratricopeptide repeat protein [Conchiformibius steedae]|uniref:Uncharacterized protein n=1 Tax=Conchiformibius steedae TaxID=153493 RepID=A0A3P2A9I9_9NEIS|nr:hypothetical protein [Conchiformibius steedae]RRD90930.1 hypothetical protein EII21_02965 [Conchiformibius steedae]
MNISTLLNQAYAAFDQGELAQATDYFAKLVQIAPHNPDYHYMQGLVAKNRMDWQTSLHANLRAIEHAPEFDEAHHWNAAIAATALSDWQTARKMWTACGIPLPEQEGEINGRFGIAVVRLNPWEQGECVYVRRIDPVRAVILNVPFPESGWQLGDIVLHDGAPTGTRQDGQGNTFSVFNALMRWQASDLLTFTAFVSCDNAQDIADLQQALDEHELYGEDWTENVRLLCLRCSYGSPHSHAHQPVQSSWQHERSIGIGAPQRHLVENILKSWQSAAPKRSILDICQQTYPLPQRQDGKVWWE